MLILSLVVATLAVARITRFIVEDRLTARVRRWVVRRNGDDGLITYWIHCPWCMSIWIALVAMPVATLFPNIWVVLFFSPWAASMVTGLLLDRKE